MLWPGWGRGDGFWGVGLYKEWESVVFCGAAARLRRAAAPCRGGGQPVGLAAAPGRSAPKGRSGQNIYLYSEGFGLQMALYHFEAKAFLM